MLIHLSCLQHETVVYFIVVIQQCMRVMWDILNIEKRLNRNCKYWVYLIHNSFLLHEKRQQKTHKRIVAAYFFPFFSV